MGVVGVTTQSDLSQFNTRLPNDLVETINLHPDNNQEIAARALRKEVGLNGKSELDLRIQQKKRRANIVRDEISELEDELAGIVGDIEELQERRNQIKDPDEQRTDDLDKLLDEMVETGRCVWVGSNALGKLASNHFHGDDQDALTALKERVEECELPIQDRQFQNPNGGI